MVKIDIGANGVLALTASRCSEKARRSSDIFTLRSNHTTSPRGHDSDGIIVAVLQNVFKFCVLRI